MEQYLLLNRDVQIARFHVDEMLDTIMIDQQYRQLPSWINDLRIFIINRRAPKHREHIAELLRLSGCDTIKGYLDISHALSLIDTFWVKPVGSPLVWEDVSLYQHPFNEVIARTAFEGGLHGRGLDTTSPEYGTNGSFAKCWIRERDQIKLLKRGSSGFANAGLEPYSEYYAGQIIEAFTSNFVRYDLRSVSGRICSVCDIFTSEEYGFLPYAAVDRGNSDVVSIIHVMDKFKLAENVKPMFIIDAIIMNEDRHKNNFGFIVDNRKQEIVGFAPLFDHNISLLPYAVKRDFENADQYLLDKGPKIGDNWITVASALLDRKTRNILVNLRDFRFTKHPRYNLPDWRLEALERMIHSHIDKILKRYHRFYP